MSKKLKSLLLIFMAIMMLVMGTLAAFAEDTQEPEAETEIIPNYSFEIDEEIDGSIIVDNNREFCTCCHEHNHNEQGNKLSCFFCKIKMFFRRIFGKREENPVHKYKIIEKTDATCSEIGKTTLKCAVCKDEKVYTINKKEHTPQSVAGFAATCTEKGLTEGSVCSLCSAVITAQQEIPAKGHKFTNYVSDNNAACEKDGTKTAKCDFCEATDTKTDVGTALRHATVNHSGKPASCTEPGWADYQTCSNCDYTTYRAISALGHNKVSHAAVAATCTATGNKAYETCTRCEYTTYEAISALGHNKVSHSAVAATCTATGNKAYETCTRCDYTTFEATSALGHDKVNHAAVAATCTAGGNKAYETCTRCDYTTYEATSALGHDKVNHAAVAATCTSGGNKAYDTCTRCDYTTYEAVSALGHDKVNHAAVAATCTAAGNKAYETCTRCDYTTFEATSALGHDKVNHAAVAATCTATGNKAYETCTRCDYTTFEATSALGHDKVNHAAVAATCTVGGNKAYETCTRCDYTTFEATAALGHNKVNHAAVAATCTAGGNKAYETCTRCDYTTFEATAALGHNKVNHAAVAATCIATGNKAYETCTRCDYTTFEATAALGHNKVSYAAVAATCTAPGNNAYEACTRCDYTTYEAIGAALGHDVVTDAYIAPTCTTEGKTAGSHCSRCAEVIQAQIILTAQHDFNDGDTVANLTVNKSGIDIVTADYTCSKCGESVVQGNIPAVASVGGYNTVYHTLEAAVNSASNTNVYLLRDYTLTENLTVANGVTVVIPCLADDVGYTTRSDDGEYPNYCPDNNNGVPQAKVLYRKLTIEDSVTLTINDGTVLVSAVTGILAGGRPQSYGVSGNFAAIDLAGTINVNSGGTFDCSGYVYDNGGHINLANGARMFETYGVIHWRGGSYGMAAKAKNIFPIDEYEFDNVKTPITFNYGALYYGTVKMAANGGFLGLGDMQHFYCHMPIVGTDSSDSLYALKPGATLVKTIENGRERYVFNGDVALGFTRLTVAGTTLATNSCQFYKFDGDITVEFYNGNVTTNQKLFFLPGFEMIVGEGASLSITGTGGFLFGTANDYTIGDNTYYSYYYYDSQYDANNIPARYTAGRDDAKLYILNGGAVSLSGNSAVIAGKVYVDSASSFTTPKAVSEYTITRNVAYGEVIKSSFSRSVNVNSYTVPLMVETYEAP